MANSSFGLRRKTVWAAAGTFGRRRIDFQARKLRNGRRRHAMEPRPALCLPQFTQITRHFCIGGWSAIGKWTGVRFYDFLERIGADTSAK
jgi:hypothetical protein